MRPLPMFRFGPRARSTSLGIALCTMFIVASFSIVGGLSDSMDRLEGNFPSERFLVTVPGTAFFDPSTVTAIAPETAYGSFVEVEVNTTSVGATVFSVTDEPGIVLSPLTHVTGSEVLEPDGLSFPELMTLSHGDRSEQVRVAGQHILRQFPDAWLLGSPELLANLTGQTGKANYAITGALSASQKEDLSALGFSVQAMTGVIDFLGQSVGQIEDDMVLVLLPSAFVIAVLSYGFLGRETADRRHDIGIMKTIGAGRMRIMGALLSSAMLISLWGGALGLALGTVLTYLISTGASTVFASVFTITLDLWVLAVAYATAVVAGVAGALLPSLRMTLSSPVSDLREVPG